MTNEIMEVDKEIEASRTDANRMVEEANRLARAIVDDKSCAQAADYLLSIKTVKKKWEAFWEPICSKARDAWKETTSKRDMVLESFERPEREILKPAITKFYMEQEKKRAEEERKIMEQRRKEAEEEKIKVAAELEKAGEKEMAEQELNAPVQVAATVMPEAPKAKGISFITTWSFRIKDPVAIPREYLMIDEVKIGKIVRALKGETAIAGIEVYSEKSVAGRTR